MKRVFRIARRAYWASNGMEVARLWYFTYQENGDVFMHRFGQRAIRVEIVDPPPGRCPHCGEKLP